MPDFEITSPDGQRFIVTAPEGATQDEVLRYAQQNMPRQPAAQPQAPATPAPGAMGPFQPNTTGNAVATGAGDPFRGLEQIVSRVQQGNTDSRLMRMLQGNPNIAAAMDTTGPGRMRTPAEVDAAVQTREQEYQARRAAAGETGTDWGRMAGQVASTLPLAVAMPAGNSVLGAVAAGGVSGAALNALQPVTSGDFAEEKKQQVEMGGLLGAATGPLGYVLGRAIAPRVSPDVRALSDAGVQLTPGQAIGGMARRFEDAATSFIGPGDVIATAQRNSINSFNRAVGNRVLREIGETVPDSIAPGRELIEHVGSTISRTYDDAISRAQPFTVDQQFAQDLAAIGQRFLTPSARAEYNAIVRDNILSRLSGGTIDPATYQIIRSDLARLARGLSGAAEFAKREQGKAFSALQEAFDTLLERSNPAIAPQLQAANRAYAAFTRMSDAAGRQGAVDGVFTPSQLSEAVRRGDRSVRRGAYARGDALLQDLSDPARSVMPSSVPDSGTARRAATLAALTGGAGALGYLEPTTLGAAGLLAGAYTPAGQRALNAAIMARRAPMVDAAGTAIARSGGAAAVPLGGLLFAPTPPQFLDQRR